MNELVGKYLNGYKIVKIEQDPFIKGQVNLWTNEVRTETFGDKSVIKFFVRNESNTAKIYQELVDKEKYELQQRIDKAIEYIQEDLDEPDAEEYREYTIEIEWFTKLLEILKGDSDE